MQMPFIHSKKKSLPLFWVTVFSYALCLCATCVLLACYVAKFRVSADNPHQRKPLKIRYFLEFACLGSFLYGNCNSNSHAHHGVIAGTDQAHHFHMGGNG